MSRARAPGSRPRTARASGLRASQARKQLRAVAQQFGFEGGCRPARLLHHGWIKQEGAAIGKGAFDGGRSCRARSAAEVPIAVHLEIAIEGRAVGRNVGRRPILSAGERSEELSAKGFGE